jgi:tRNA(fMet)-specific endonuclease VapC
MQKVNAGPVTGFLPQLRAKGTPIGPYDVLIAGQAVARKLTLITHNRREFIRVEGLLTEDWET